MKVMHLVIEAYKDTAIVLRNVDGLSEEEVAGIAADEFSNYCSYGYSIVDTDVESVRDDIRDIACKGVYRAETDVDQEVHEEALKW